jgi:uncharacterized protein (TIGR03437 family)
MKRLVTLLLMLASLAPAYYHYVRFTSRSAPFVPVFEKFDLNALVDQTVRYYVSDQGPTDLAPNDSFVSVLSEIRLAAKTWNDVPSSALRLAFGGLNTAGTPQTSPGIDIIFDDVPPGLIAVGGPTVRADLSLGPSGPFVPITRSVVILRRDLTQRPSYSEGFFLTVVHELGHALGLQHTLTSSVMSTEITRATTKAKPLAADDMAGISLLYPAASFAASTGTITGQVTLFGQGINLASVVALSPQGGAISTLTNPDGTYRIEGLPPGQYFLYVHPLPPPLAGEVSPANVVLPLDLDLQPIAAGPLFDTQFYPGVKDPQMAIALPVVAGASLDGLNFSVQPRSAPSVYAVQTYSFPGPVPVKPAYLGLSAPQPFLLASGIGLSVNGAPASGLRASVVGGSAAVFPGGLIPYAPDPRWVQIYLQFNPFSGEGPRHLLFSLDSDVYVLPSAMYVTQKQPPFIASATPAFDTTGNRVVAITGTNLFADTRILFDGVPAVSTQVDEFGTLLVVPPPGPSGHRASIVALNSDGQSSLFLQATAPTYDYDLVDASFFMMAPQALSAGSEAMVEVTGINTGFVEGQTTLGFGSSDIAVRRVWVISPTRLLANVAVSANAAQTAATATVCTGLRVLTQPFAFQVLPFNPASPTLHTPALDAVTGQPGLQAGGTGLVQVSQFFPEQSGGNLSLTLNDRPATIFSAANGQIVFQVPPDLVPGPAVLSLRVGQTIVPPVVVTIQPPPPTVSAVFVPPGTTIDASRPARRGEFLDVLVAGLGDASAAIAPERVTVMVGGIEQQVMQIVPSQIQPGFQQLQFILSSTVPSGAQVPLTVAIDGRTSAPFPLAVSPF